MQPYDDTSETPSRKIVHALRWKAGETSQPPVKAHTTEVSRMLELEQRSTSRSHTQRGNVTICGLNRSIHSQTRSGGTRLGF